MTMPITQFSLSGKAYKSLVFTGFSRLQKEEEFVDLTLAADGCFCKVHKSLIALASPYLRDILRNLQGSSPVIYLNKVRKEILEYILEYIYQGDVNIPGQLVEEFIEVSKSLHIAGIADLESAKVSYEPPKNTAKKAKKRKLRDRIPNIEVSDNITNTDNDSNDDYCTEVQKQTSNGFKLQSLRTNLEQEPIQQVTAKYANEDLITFHNRKEQHNYQTIHIENEIPTKTRSDLVQSCNAQSYKIIVKPAKEQTEVAENIPVIEIQSLNIPCQQDNSIIIGQPHEVLMQANTNPDRNNVEQSLPLLNIPTNDNIKSPATEFITQSSKVRHPLIQIVAIPEKHNGDKSLPVLKILRNEVIKSTETEYDTQSLQTVINLDQNNVQKSVPVSAETNLGDLSFKASLNDMKNMAQYSITERGALQLILNRFIYCCHGASTKKQRWRCIEYRRGACSALVDTDADGAIVQRKGTHKHEFHDKKIFKKHNRGLIFSTKALAVVARDSSQKEGLKMVSIEEVDDGDDSNQKMD